MPDRPDECFLSGKTNRQPLQWLICSHAQGTVAPGRSEAAIPAFVAVMLVGGVLPSRPDEVDPDASRGGRGYARRR